MYTKNCEAIKKLFLIIKNRKWPKFKQWPIKQNNSKQTTVERISAALPFQANYKSKH